MTTGQNSTLEPEALLVHTTQFIFRSTVALGPKNLTLIRMDDRRVFKNPLSERDFTR